MEDPGYEPGQSDFRIQMESAGGVKVHTNSSVKDKHSYHDESSRAACVHGNGDRDFYSLLKNFIRSIYYLLSLELCQPFHPILFQLFLYPTLFFLRYLHFNQFLLILDFSFKRSINSKIYGVPWFSSKFYRGKCNLVWALSIVVGVPKSLLW